MHGGKKLIFNNLSAILILQQSFPDLKMGENVDHKVNVFFHGSNSELSRESLTSNLSRGQHNVILKTSWEVPVVYII